MQAPNGVCPSKIPSLAFWIASRMKRASTWYVICRTCHSNTSHENSKSAGVYVQNRISGPVFVIEMPPFKLVNGKAFIFHGAAKQLAVPPGEGCAARIIGIRALGHLVVEPGHLDRLSGGEIVEREVHRTAAVVPRSLAGVGDENALIRRCAIPKHFGYIPRSVRIVDQQPVTHTFELAMCAHQRFRRRTLKESPGLGIKNRLQKIVCRGVADVQLDGR